MPLPVAVNIGGHRFSVELVDVVNKYQPRRGEIRHLEGRILIDSSMMESRREQSLLHEILHEIDQQCGLGLEETDVGRLAEALYAVLVNNRLTFGGHGATTKTG